MPQRGLVGSVQRPTTLALQIFISISLHLRLRSILRCASRLVWGGTSLETGTRWGIKQLLVHNIGASGTWARFTRITTTRAFEGLVSLEETSRCRTEAEYPRERARYTRSGAVQYSRRETHHVPDLTPSHRRVLHAHGHTSRDRTVERQGRQRYLLPPRQLHSSREDIVGF